MTNMNADIKTEWLNRLRSGDYKQGTSVLHNLDEGTMCCLGVLCEMAAEEGVIPVDGLSTDVTYKWDPDAGIEVKKNIRSYSGQRWYLPLVVANWAGLTGPDENRGVFGADEDSEGISVATMNDGGKSFADIADVIEELA